VVLVEEAVVVLLLTSHGIQEALAVVGSNLCSIHQTLS
jgi:hypothetical protein